MFLAKLPVTFDNYFGIELECMVQICCYNTMSTQLHKKTAGLPIPYTDHTMLQYKQYNMYSYNVVYMMSYYPPDVIL